MEIKKSDLPDCQICQTADKLKDRTYQPLVVTGHN
jgi:hypothetical protein